MLSEKEFANKYYAIEISDSAIEQINKRSINSLIEVPRDYSFGVDKKYKELLSYGHINLYTPSLLNFLLKSENFTILKNEKAFYSKEIIEYSWKGNNKKLSYLRKMKLYIYLVFR